MLLVLLLGSQLHLHAKERRPQVSPESLFHPFTSFTLSSLDKAFGLLARTAFGTLHSSLGFIVQRVTALHRVLRSKLDWISWLSLPLTTASRSSNSYGDGIHAAAGYSFVRRNRWSHRGSGTPLPQGSRYIAASFSAGSYAYGGCWARGRCSAHEGS